VQNLAVDGKIVKWGEHDVDIFLQKTWEVPNRFIRIAVHSDDNAAVVNTQLFLDLFDSEKRPDDLEKRSHALVPWCNG
jgi:hypothetical protein